MALLSGAVLRQMSLVVAATLGVIVGPVVAPDRADVAWRSTVQRGNHDGYQCYNAPSIVALEHCEIAPTVLVAFLEARKECHDHGVWMDLVSYRSLDVGRTWTAPRLVHGESNGSSVNVTVGGPTAVVDKATGRLIVLMIRNDPRRKSFDILLTHSDDCGESFSPPRDISASVKPPPGTLGAPWGFYATTFRAIQLHSGRLMACCDHSIDGQLDPYPIDTNHAHVIVSDSGGDTWALGGTIHMNSSDECSVAQLGSGRVVMNMRNYIDQRTHKVVTAPGHIVRAFADSTDDGATFGPVRFAADLPDPICFSDLLRVNASTHGFGDIPSDNMRADDDLLLLSNPSSTVGRRNLSIHASLDGGHEWQPLLVVEDRGLRGSGYSHMVALPPDPVDGAGRLGVLYVQDYHVGAQTNGWPAGALDNHTFALVTFRATRNDRSAEKQVAWPAEQ